MNRITLFYIVLVLVVNTAGCIFYGESYKGGELP